MGATRHDAVRTRAALFALTDHATVARGLVYAHGLGGRVAWAASRAWLVLALGGRLGARGLRRCCAFRGRAHCRGDEAGLSRRSGAPGARAPRACARARTRAFARSLACVRVETGCAVIRRAWKIRLRPLHRPACPDAARGGGGGADARGNGPAGCQCRFRPACARGGGGAPAPSLSRAVARNLNMFFRHVGWTAANFHIRTIGFVCPPHRIVTLSVIVASAHAFLTVSDDFPIANPLHWGGSLPPCLHQTPPRLARGA